MIELKKERIIALDTLRGLTIIAMIIVNDPGSWNDVYEPLLHAKWHGVTPTDLIFPFFLFIVGVSITLAYTRRLDEGLKLNLVYKKIMVRAIKIMLLGWFLWLWPYFDFSNIRLAGVLPRISLVFLVCAFIFLKTSWKQQVWIGSIILLGYWAMLALVPVPIDEVIQTALKTGKVNYSEGLLSIGTLSTMGNGYIAANYEPGVNITAWIDRWLLPGKFWQITWDPEGLVSTLPAIVTGIIGMLVGKLMLTVNDTFKKLTWLFFVGFCLYLTGELWGWLMPLNKNLWTSSYVLWTAGMATLGLASCYLIIDVLGFRYATRAGRIFGANAIISYSLAGMLTIIFYGDTFGFSLNNLWMDLLTSFGVAAKLASLTYAIIYTMIIYLPIWLLYRKNIIIRI